MMRRHKIWIMQAASEARNDDGLPVTTWESITDEPIWANVRDEGASEFYGGDADFNLTKIKVNISYREDVSRKMRVIFNDRVYEIVRTYRDDYRRLDLDFDAERRSNEDGLIHV